MGFLHSFGLRWVPVCRGSEGSSPWARIFALQTCIRQDRGILTMMRSCASDVGLQPTGLTRGEAPGGGPILSVGIKCHVRIRHPATSDRQFGNRAEKPARAPNGAECYARFGKPF